MITEGLVAQVFKNYRTLRKSIGHIESKAKTARSNPWDLRLRMCLEAKFILRKAFLDKDDKTLGEISQRNQASFKVADVDVSADPCFSTGYS